MSNKCDVVVGCKQEWGMTLLVRTRVLSWVVGCKQEWGMTLLVRTRVLSWVVGCKQDGACDVEY